MQKTGEIRPFPSLSEVFRNAFRLFLSHLFFVSLAKLLYDFLPYYQNFLSPEAKRTFALVYPAYVLLAPIYYLLAFWIGWLKPSDIKISKSTLMLRYLIKLPSAFRRYLSVGYSGTVFPAELKMDTQTRTAFLALAVKMFFIPLMVNFLYEHIRALTSLTARLPQHVTLYQWIFDWLYKVLLEILFIVDIATFVFAYASEARWLGNQIKSVEPTFFGWAVAIGCYPPFNGIVGGYFPTGNSGPLVITSQPVLAVFKCLIILLYLIYVWASVSLMTRAGNLVNRGIVSRGAYGIVRHPAYISKCSAWWFEHLPYILFDFKTIFFLFCWNIIYFLRAITEEKHLLATSPEYAEYARRVKYRFIPGIF